jgi:D-alanyl-D-alanine carboxypeptidase/D-alanyl-D-alanine-endopeptidase (penicillin-binding protein 4)
MSYVQLLFLLIGSAIQATTFSLDHASLGIYAVDTNTKEILVDQNSDLSVIPASCMKVVTTGAALQILGEKARFETHLEYNGTIDAKTLKGNIYIHGGGDPCLGSDRIEGSLSWQKQIEAWANAVQALGVQTIEGTVIGDATRWEKALAVPSWAWEDLGNYYGAGASALSFHENAYSLFFKPDPIVGEKATLLRTEPSLPLFAFQNEVTTGPVGSGDNACIYGSEFSTLSFVRGTIPAAVSEFAIKGSIPDPASYCASLFTEALRKRGIAVGEQPLQTDTKRIIFHTTKSPTIGEIVYWANQKSINLYAEHLLKKMGEVLYQEGSTAAGIKAVTHFWRSQGIDLDGFNMVDGSGLSRKNLVTAKQLVQILQRMKTSDSFPIFLQSLPEQPSSIRAKSGSMSLIKGYVGYANNTAFAIVVNQCTNHKLLNQRLDEFITNLSKPISK